MGRRAGKSRDLGSSPFLSRRALLALTAGSGAVALAGAAFGTSGAALAQPVPQSAASNAPPGPAPVQDPLALTAAYLAITPDNRVRFTCPAAEIGQGAATVLAQLVAEDLDADWDQIDVVIAGAGESYLNPMKRLQSVSQSMNVRGYHDLIRQIGAAARQKLVMAAADKWDMDPALLKTARCAVSTPDGKRHLTYAALAAAAAKKLPAAVPPLRPRDQFRLIGQSLPRKDTLAKVTGQAVFGLDVVRPGMLNAAIQMAPVAGARIQSYDRAAMEKMPGVKAVIETKTGLAPAIAVVADRWWQAKTALDAGRIEFAPPEKPVFDGTARDFVRGLLSATAIEAHSAGTPAPALAKAAKTAEFTYDVPYLAHAAMEPLTAVAEVGDGTCDIWAAPQSQIRARDEVAELLGLPKDKVTIHSVYAGGGFGRRWPVDYILQAAEIAKAAGRPVKLIWSREQDMSHDYFRPACALKAMAGFDAAGNLSGLELKVSGASLTEWGRPGRLKGAADPTAVSGLKDAFAAVPHLKIGWVPTPTPVPVGFWRSVGHSQNGFFQEALADELALQAGKDPVAFRRALIGSNKRAAAVLDKVLAMSGWGRSLGPHEGLGLARLEAYGTEVAHVIHVTLAPKDKGGTLKINRIWCAVDCGYPVNPAGVIAQAKSAIIYGLSAALWGEITLDGAGIGQSNFSDYRVLTFPEAPVMDVAIVETGAKLGGMGEPALPGVAPALVNAIAAAGGPRLRSLPVMNSGWDLA